MSGKNYDTINNMSIENVESIFAKNYNKIKSQNKPYLIIKYGPTGSGKGSKIVTKEILALGIPLHKYVTIEIDGLVEKIKSYRNTTMKIHNKYKKSTNKNKNKYNELYNAYYKTREDKNTRGLSISDKLNNVLEQSIKNNKNIIFETTGSRPNSHPIEDLLLMIKDNYKVILIYPIVPPDDIKTRVTSRSQQQLRLSKPLYRNINPDNIDEWWNNSMENFKEFIIPEVLKGRIHKLIVVSN